APTQFIYVFRVRNTVQVLTQTHILHAALRADRWSTFSDERYGVDLYTWNLVNRLRARDPEAADLLLSSQNVPDQELVERVLLRLLQGRAAERRTGQLKQWHS